jgi:hypothetical protein
MDTASLRGAAVTADEQDLSDELVAYYRRVLVTHGSTNEPGVCPACDVARCRDWLDAYDRLAASNKLMGEASQWHDIPRKHQP